ncbi:MAG: hypothetical protein HC865_05850 [Cyanobacteria bacterium RU_5_0]|nr:hypothetical protein [Cyanobacteria bacterium RU_5_0]
MNPPLVVEIAIGLIFIYLTLSLLTSEIQELISILLQWRAEHLKKSIENLLTGDNKDDPLYRKFTDELYESPLIRALNQEAKGILAVFFRKIIQALIAIYYLLTGTRNIFGRQKSGPSYIPAETFSVALLQKINITQLSQTISELTARKFRDESLTALREILDDLRFSLGSDPLLIGDDSLLEKQFRSLEHNLEDTIEDFVSGRTTLSNSIEQISDRLILFIDNANSLLAEENHCKEIIRHRLTYLKQTIARKQLEPTVAEVLRLIFAEDELNGIKLSPWLTEILTKLEKEHPELLRKVADLPRQLKRNLLSLAEQARIKAKSLEGEVRQLEKEIADWFNNSMDRASGVYRRNAKGIAILIGFIVAIVINADTFHIVSRLSKDSVIRSTITDTADQLVAQRNSTAPIAPNPLFVEPSPSASPDSASQIQNNLQQVKEAVDGMLDELPLPIGWNPINISEQEAASQGWAIPILRRLIGWFITGVALSMGATFWYDLLSQVSRVRSTGRRPGERREEG